MNFLNRPRDYSNKPPISSIIPGVLSVVDTPSINLTYNSSLHILQADIVPVLLTPGTYGSTTQIPVFTVNNLGQITSITQVPAAGGGSGVLTLDNGLTLTGTNGQLGGPLIQDTTINAGLFNLSVTGANTPGSVLSIINTAIGVGGYFEALSGGTAIAATSSGKPSIISVGVGVTPLLASNNVLGATDEPVAVFSRRIPSGSVSIGTGAYIDISLPRGSLGVLHPGSRIVTRHTSVGANYNSTLEFWSQTTNFLTRKAQFLPTGQVVLDNYLGTTFDAVPFKSLGVDTIGNLVTFTGGGGGGSLLNDTTGILFGGVLSATIGGTTFSVTAGIGQIVTQTASISGVVTTVTNVTWSAVVGAAITNIATSQFTYVLVNSSGVVIQQTTPFTDAQYKTHIIIGIICHINLASVNLVTNAQNVAYEDPHRLVELISTFGAIKKSGLNISANGANLRVNRTSGEAFKIGSNYITDQFEPDVRTIAAQTPALLCRVHRNGSGGFIFDVNGGLYYNDIDPNQYDDGSGTLQSVGGSKWTIQRLFFFPNNPVDIICYYGVQVYNQFSEARANLEFETFDEAQITAENAVFLGFLFVRNAATNLSLATQAVFLQSGLFRGIPAGGGGSGGGGNSIGELTGDVTTPAATSPSQSVAATLKTNLKIGSFGVTVDGVSSVIQVGQTGFVTMPYDGTITGWSISANAIGNIEFDIWKASGAIPILANSIVAAAFPTLTAAQFVTSTIMTSWTLTFAAGDVFGFYVNSISGIKNATLTLRCTKS